MSTLKICPVLECGQSLHEYKTGNGEMKFGMYCDYHTKGGYWLHGDSFAQYQIIEEDFANYLKFVPLTTEHFNVHSPKLRDIIIRSCVEVEIFLKEWAKEQCADPKCELLISYNDTTKWGKKGDINWNMAEYSYFSKFFNPNYPIEVSPLRIEINPFENWDKSKVPFWWSAYNKIKHNGYKYKSEANLKNALYALAALFQLHCTHEDSLRDLQFLIPMSVYKDVVDDTINAAMNDITTPIDTKRYLFRAVASNMDRPTPLITKEELERDYDLDQRYDEWDDY